MFTKPASSKPFAPVKSSERKKYLSQICREFGVQESSLPTEHKNVLFPKDLKIGKIVTHGGTRGSLVVDGNDKPIWVNMKETLVPTVYTLWKAPYLVPRVMTVENTIQFLENGADLMSRGVFEPYPTGVKKGDIVSIATLSHPTVPVAVGYSLINFDEIAYIQGGKAVQIVNVINDRLCLSGLAQRMENVPTELDLTIPTISEDTAETTAETAEVPVSVEKAKEEETSDPTSKENKATLEEQTASLSLDDLSVEEVDRALKRSLLQVLKKSIEEPLELPLPTNTMTSLMMANLPFNHPSIQMKKSSWKKANKFFKAMEKEKLIKTRERSGELVITEICKENTAIREFQLFKPAKPWNPNSENATPPKTGKGLDKLQMTQYWRAKSAAVDFFSKSKLDRNGYYTNDQLKKYLLDYLKNLNDKNIPQPKDKKFVAPDAELAKALKLDKAGTKIGRDKLLSALQSSCTQFHTITHPGQPESKLAKGGFPTIKLSTEKRTGTKVITKIVGLELFLIEPSKFAEELKIACAGSATVTPIREGVKEVQIIIQGNHIKTITKILEDKGVRSSWISK